MLAKEDQLMELIALTAQLTQWPLIIIKAAHQPHVLVTDPLFYLMVHAVFVVAMKSQITQEEVASSQDQCTDITEAIICHQLLLDKHNPLDKLQQVQLMLEHQKILLILIHITHKSFQ